MPNLGVIIVIPPVTTASRELLHALFIKLDRAAWPRIDPLGIHFYRLELSAQPNPGIRHSEFPAKGDSHSLAGVEDPENLR
jgi:hypothetical protein